MSTVLGAYINYRHNDGKIYYDIIYCCLPLYIIISQPRRRISDKRLTFDLEFFANDNDIGMPNNTTDAYNIQKLPPTGVGAVSVVSSTSINKAARTF